MRENLRAARLKREWTQAEMARRAGISKSHYTLIETGQRKPSLDVAHAISEALGSDLDPAGLFETAEEVGA